MRIKPSLALTTCIVVGLALWASGQMDLTGTSMATAAKRFVAALSADQKAKALFAYDDAERLNWHFIPRARKGLPIKDMTSDQRALAFGLVQSGLSRSGTIKATTIMSLEAILKELEQGRGPVRDPELYFFSIFGEPSNKGRWGWRVEGHHLSLNFVIEDGKITAATPAFFGSNPGEVRDGPRKGLRTLALIEDSALRLLQALDADQRKTAVVAEKAPADIPSNTGQTLESKPRALPNEGIEKSRMNDNQKRLLSELINAYASDMPTDVANAWLADVDRSGDDVRFSWYGAADRNLPHAYLVKGSTFVIEFNNTQNNANHIHSLWRGTVGDFGLLGGRR